MAAKRQAAIGFIFVTLLIDITGIGMIVPIVPKLITELIHGNLNEASGYGGLLQFAYAAAQFLCAPIIGGLSDRYGRRPVLLGSLLGFSIDYGILAWAPTIGWLFVGRIIAGIMGGSWTTASAYIADVSPPEKRAESFGIIGAAFGLGFIIGPLIGGLLGQYGSRIPFVAAGILALINWLYGFLILPESHKLENRRAFEWKRANPFGAVKHLTKYPVIKGLVVTVLLIYIAQHAVQSTWTYYTMEKFGWDVKMVGISLGVVGIASALVQGLLIRKIIPKFGKERSIYAGLTLLIIGFIFFAFATMPWMMFATICVYCLGGVAGPALQGIMSLQVPVTEQGELQGALTGMLGLTAIIGPLLMTEFLFHYFTNPAHLYFPGAPMIAGAILVTVSLIFAVNTLTKKNIAH